MAETISGEIPAWLVKRGGPFEASSTAQDIQLGAQLAHHAQQEARLQRAAQLQEEAKRLAIEQKERAVQGTMEVARVLAKMGQSGGYNDPALQGEFWSAIEKNPEFAGTEQFKHIMDNFQYAEQAKTRAALLDKTYDLRGQQSELRHLQRLDEIDAQLESALSVEGLKQEDRTKLEGVLQRNRLERDSLKPTRTGELVHDLPESELKAMTSELATLDNLFKANQIKGTKKPGAFSSGYLETPNAEYARRKREVIDSYSKKRIVAPKPVEQAVKTPAPAREQREAGKVYETPKGPYRWNGSGWEAP